MAAPVQTGSTRGSTATLTVTLANPTAANARIVCVVSIEGGTAAAPVPSGWGVTTWVADVNNGTNRRVAIFSGISAGGVQAGTIATGVAVMALTVFELAPGVVLDSLGTAVATNSAQSASSSGGSVTPTTGGDAIVVFGVQGTVAYTTGPTNSFTTVSGTGHTDGSGYRAIASASGAYNGGYGSGNNYNVWGGASATYKTSGAAAVVGPAVTIAPPPQWGAVGTGIFARTRFLSSVVAPTRTLNAGSGGFVETGTAATLAAARKLAMAGGAYVESGTAAALRHGYALAAGAGVFTETGTAATLRFGHKIAVGSGAYVLTGTAATLVKSGSVTLAAGSGTYVVAGIGAGLVHGRLLAAAGTSYTETGTAATLTKGPHRLHGVSGKVSVLGKVATMVWSGAPFVRPVAPTTLRIRHAIMNPDGTLIWSDPP